MNTTTASTDLDQPAEPLGGEPDDTAPLPECICPANGIGPDWVEVSECTSGLPHLSWCPRALAGVDSVGPFPQEPALRPPFPVPCESGVDGRPQDHDAEGWTVSPEGLRISRQCRRCSEAATTEYREKLGEEWTFQPFGSPEAMAQAAEQGEVWSLGDLYQKRSNFETERRRQIRMGFETVAVAHGQSVDEATRRGRLIASAPDLLRERNEARQQRDVLDDALEDARHVINWLAESPLAQPVGVELSDAAIGALPGIDAALRKAGRS